MNTTGGAAKHAAVHSESWGYQDPSQTSRPTTPTGEAGFPPKPGGSAVPRQHSQPPVPCPVPKPPSLPPSGWSCWMAAAQASGPVCTRSVRGSNPSATRSGTFQQLSIASGSHSQPNHRTTLHMCHAAIRPLCPWGVLPVCRRGRETTLQHATPKHCHPPLNSVVHSSTREPVGFVGGLLCS